MATYVIGDIHGCYNEWIVLKNKIESQDKEARFILIGDIIDRGERAYEMILWAMKNITTDGKYQMVMGNHEQMKINYWDEYCQPYFDKMGIEITDDLEQIKKSDILIDNYNYIYTFITNNKGFKELKKTVDWFRDLEYYKDITINNQRFIIAHGNITESNVNKEKNTIREDLGQAEKENILWDRSTDKFTAIKDAILVYGHTPTLINEAYDYRVETKDRHYGRIYHGLNRINIDCGIAYRANSENANLAALRLEDLAEFYVFE